ncbi:hypothetical protein [Deinococcus sedimenti]|nr:hypothetical protein [Deinococcus sedimenti]
MIDGGDSFIFSYSGIDISISNYESNCLAIEFPSSCPDISIQNLNDWDVFVSPIQKSGRIMNQRAIILHGSGIPSEIIDSALFHIGQSFGEGGSAMRRGNFKSYLNGKRYIKSWEAFEHFMKNIKGDRVTSQDDHYVSFDTGGIPLGIQKTADPETVIISYDLRDYEGLYDEYREQILELINGVALRHREICFLIDRERLLICNKFYVSPETDALNLFTAQLQAIHDALLDYLTTVQDAPENAWLRAAREAFVRGQPLPRA